VRRCPAYNLAAAGTPVHAWPTGYGQLQETPPREAAPGAFFVIGARRPVEPHDGHEASPEALQEDKGVT